jgi:putative ABC transport system permease protein
MSWWKGRLARARTLFLRRAADSRMDEEFTFHIERETEQNIRAGMTMAEARRQALLAFGGVERHREEMRDGRRLTWLEDAVADARFTLRWSRW